MYMYLGKYMNMYMYQRFEWFLPLQSQKGEINFHILSVIKKL